MFPERALLEFRKRALCLTHDTRTGVVNCSAYTRERQREPCISMRAKVKNDTRERLEEKK